MKTRNVLYGYRYENGEIGCDQVEAQRFLEMTGMYLGGMSLGDIAKAFNEQQIEYSPGITGWNKSRIMRLLSDERYTGDGKYPAIISEDTRRQLLERRDSNSCLTNTDFSDEIYRLAVPIICPECGDTLKRKANRGRKGMRCLNCPSCGYTAYIKDEDLIGEIKQMLTRLVSDPSPIITEETSVLEDGTEIADLRWDIERSLERPDIKTDSVANNIRKLAALRYGAIGEQYYISQKLRREFIESGQLKEESPDIWQASLIDLANRTVSGINIGENGIIIVMLMSGQALTEGA